MISAWHCTEITQSALRCPSGIFIARSPGSIRQICAAEMTLSLGQGDSFLFTCTVTYCLLAKRYSKCFMSFHFQILSQPKIIMIRFSKKSEQLAKYLTCKVIQHFEDVGMFLEKKVKTGHSKHTFPSTSSFLFPRLATPACLRCFFIAKQSKFCNLSLCGLKSDGNSWNSGNKTTFLVTHRKIDPSLVCSPY